MNSRSTARNFFWKRWSQGSQFALAVLSNQSVPDGILSCSSNSKQSWHLRLNSILSFWIRDNISLELHVPSQEKCLPLAAIEMHSVALTVVFVWWSFLVAHFSWVLNYFSKDVRWEEFFKVSRRKKILYLFRSFISNSSLFSYLSPLKWSRSSYIQFTCTFFSVKLSQHCGYWKICKVKEWLYLQYVHFPTAGIYINVYIL